ncbi:MAG: dsDNA-specific endonuclease/ATPase MutS2 [Flavobacteriaceae bacterium]|jgi:dsDNA-specific endonuclease/ATPase MutS2
MKIGDKVSVLDEDITGEIKAVLRNDITIIDSDGFEYQYFKKELVLESNDFSNLNISPQNISEIISEKEQKKNKNTPKVKSKDRNLPPMEVDLHIQQLVSKTRGLDNFEMMNIQLDTARYKITFAISKKIQRIVFIHGVGEGVLKYELHRLLKEYEGQLKFYDADYQKYGIGATEVYLFQNKK